jgi:hypothetical protein
MKRKIITAILVLILITGAVAAWKYFEKTDDLVRMEPAASVTATALINAFDHDTAAAARLYLNKVIAVSGTVIKIDSSAVELGEEGSLSAVVFGIDERHLSDIRSLKTGTTITLQGECTTYEKGGGNDMLADLGTTIQVKAAGVKTSK